MYDDQILHILEFSKVYSWIMSYLPGIFTTESICLPLQTNVICRDLFHINIIVKILLKWKIEYHSNYRSFDILEIIKK